MEPFLCEIEEGILRARKHLEIREDQCRSLRKELRQAYAKLLSGSQEERSAERVLIRAVLFLLGDPSPIAGEQGTLGHGP
jgi:hypothetical protein